MWAPAEQGTWWFILQILGFQYLRTKTLSYTLTRMATSGEVGGEMSREHLLVSNNWQYRTEYQTTVELAGGWEALSEPETSREHASQGKKLAPEEELALEGHLPFLGASVTGFNTLPGAQGWSLVTVSDKRPHIRPNSKTLSRQTKGRQPTGEGAWGCTPVSA